jgi:hypothetical protein
MRSIHHVPGIAVAAAITLNLTALPAGAAAGTAAPPPAGHRVVRVGIEPDGPSSAAAPHTAAMIAEADAIWRAYGVTVVWLQTGDAREIATCDVRLTLGFAPGSDAGSRPADPLRHGRPGLGAIWFDESGLPARAVTIDAAMIAAQIRETRLNGRPLDGWPPGLVDTIVGRALGRVLAHELGHYLLSSPAHAPAGLMRAAFDSRRLAGWDRRPFMLSPAALPRLRARLARLDLLDQPFASVNEDLP